MERLTKDLAEKAREHINEIENSGGMAKAIEAGIPKLRIEEAAARTQARIDSGQQSVIGVNRYRPETESLVNVLRVDNAEVRSSQISQLEELKATRDQKQCQIALEELTNAAEKNQNLLVASVKAARARATVGEISDALEKIFGRHRAEVRTISGVFSSEVGDNEAVQTVRDSADKFETDSGRRPRILVAKIGQDGHDRGQKVIASAFADLGFEVDIGPLFATPSETAMQAVENDVHVVGVSSLAAGHLTLVPQLKEELESLGRGDIAIVVGGVIPPDDFDALKNAGVAAVFPSGTVIAEAALELLEKLS